MDAIHEWGVDVVASTQSFFKGYSEPMLWLSDFGGPKNAFLICFPLGFFVNKETGIKALWAGAISEWLNTVLKWFLFGQRPYWWVHTTDHYLDESRPTLAQFSLTCETGPGSPSGHAMVTTAAWFVIFRSLSSHWSVEKQEKSQSPNFTSSLATWTLFVAMVLCVSVSRCFIAAHFPHQVVMGTIVGVLIGECVVRSTLHTAKVSAYFLCTVLAILSAPLCRWSLEAVGLDLDWSVSVAKQWCARPEWVYLDTTPYFVVVRDASILLGMGLALWLKASLSRSKDTNIPSAHEYGTAQALLGILLAVVAMRGLEGVPLPQSNLTVFYGLAFCRYASMPSLVVLVIPWLLNITLGNQQPPEAKIR